MKKRFKKAVIKVKDSQMKIYFVQDEEGNQVCATDSEYVDLLTAAPEMLEALKIAEKLALSYLGVAHRAIHGEIALQIRTISNAIMKAEGKQE
jgi:hypothetical protein